MGSKSKAPAAPNYSALATQQAKLDREQDIWRMQNSSQKDMYGSSGFVMGPDGKYSQVSTMSPELEAQHKASQGMFNKYQGQAGAQGEFQGPDQIQWDPFGSKQYADALYTNYAGRAIKEQGEAQQKMQTQLRQQGLQPGTEAYDRAYKNLMTSQLDANAQASLEANTKGYDLYRNDFTARNQAQQQNYAQDMQNYQLPWQQMADAQGSWNSLREGPQGYAPSWTGQSADMMGAADKSYNAKMGASNASNQKKGQTTSAAAGLGSAAMM